MSLRKEFQELEQEFESYSIDQKNELRLDAKRMGLEAWIKKYPIVKRVLILVFRVLALLPFTGPVADIALNGVAEILERD